MSKSSGVPDAWDDDWESQADRIATKEKSPQSSPQSNLSRQQRLQQHAEANKKLWESAESTETFHYIEANNGVPLSTGFKPQVKVLSRKPVIAKRDPVTGMALLGVDDDEGDPKGQEVQMTPEEIRAKQKRDRDEKQRKYDEARAKIFGESAPSSRGSSPGNGTVTPPRTDGRGSHQGRGRGRGGGGFRNNSSNVNNNYNSSNTSGSNSGRPVEPRRPANASGPKRELFDPGYSPKSADSGRRGGAVGYSSDSSSRGPSGRDEQQAIRAPRGPDGSGRGGFGFAQHGNRET